MSSSVSLLEHFPDEIFYEIFEYLSVDDLYYGIYDLNTRLTSILTSLTNLHGELTTKDQIQSPAFRLFSSHITTLKINRDDAIDLSLFPAIRSLRLHSEPNRIQCQLIQRLPHLEHLYVSRCSEEHFYYSTSLSLFLFTNCFPSLQTCQLNLVLFKDNQRWTLVPSLHTLSICVSDSRVFAQVLHSCPSLIRFRLEFTEHFVRPSKTYDDSSHLSLRQLDLCLHRTTLSCCQIIDLLLSIVPNLTYFSVRGCLSHANNINIDTLAAILHQRLTKLRQFDFQMAIPQSLVIDILKDNGLRTRQLHSLFRSVQMRCVSDDAPSQLFIASKD